MSHFSQTSGERGTEDDPATKATDGSPAGSFPDEKRAQMSENAASQSSGAEAAEAKDLSRKSSPQRVSESTTASPAMRGESGLAYSALFGLNWPWNGRV